MLHRTSEEIDKKGNVIGGDLKKKCDSFIACLDRFKNQYLSDKFNAGTESGKAQDNLIKQVENWLQGAKKADKELIDNIKEALELFKGKKSFFEGALKSANKGQLSVQMIEDLYDFVNKGHKGMVERTNCENAAIDGKNAAIQEEYKRKWDAYLKYKAQYEYAWSEYRRKLAWWNNLPDEQKLYPNRHNVGNRYTSPAPGKRYQTKYMRPQEPNMAVPVAPRTQNYIARKEMPKKRNVSAGINSGDSMNLLMEIVKRNQTSGGEVAKEPATKRTCEKYAKPLFKSAIDYIDGYIDNWTRTISAEATRKRFVTICANENGGDVFWCFRLVYEYDENGIPYMSKNKLGDIYYSVLFLNISDIFKAEMSKFKSDDKGHSITKKWIDGVVKSLPKKIPENDCEELCKKRLDNLSESLKIKAPMSISKRPTIKQKPVKEELEALAKYVLNCKKNTPNIYAF